MEHDHALVGYVNFWRELIVTHATTSGRDGAADFAEVFPGPRHEAFGLVRDADNPTGQFFCWVNPSSASTIHEIAKTRGFSSVLATGPHASSFNCAVAVDSKIGKQHVQPAAVINALHEQTGKQVGVFFNNRTHKGKRLYAMDITDPERANLFAATGGRIRLMGNQDYSLFDYAPTPADVRL